MCGIAGIFNHAAPCDREILENMTSALRHRGPDAEGFYINGCVGLGHRRLSIIDLSPDGKQPMCNEDGTIWVVFNGEIYNFCELRESLMAKGHRFRTRTDTETIVHLYEDCGKDLVHHLRGMFALAVYDERKRTLLLARDRVGKKPLVYVDGNDCFLFASEIQGLLKHPAVDTEVNINAIKDFMLYGYIPPPETGFRTVRKLPPAHLLLYSEEGARVERYWDLSYYPKQKLTEVEACERLRHELREAVRLRMVSDVPLGAFLSGGVDSSAVVALMSEVSATPVKTFSIAFEEQEYNEATYARSIATRFGTDHHELTVRPSALQVLPLLVRHYGEPYADSSAIPSYYVAKATREHVTVALNGDGGDESFAGYERYLGNVVAERYGRLPLSVRRSVIEPIGALLPGSNVRRNRWSQLRRFLKAASLPMESRYARWVSMASRELLDSIYSTEFKRAIRWQYAQDDSLLRFAGERNGLDAIDSALRIDVHSYLPSDLLVKMDIATMANSLEARSPFLDHRLMEFAATLPSSFKIRGMCLKYLLKQSFRQALPRENIERRKQGFGVPVGEWFRTELKDLLIDTVLSQTAMQRGYFEEATLRQMVDAHIGKRDDHTAPLWALLMLELWHREFVD